MHRDLKSPNVLIGDQWEAKLCDLGLSRVKLNTYVDSGFGGGTFGWMGLLSAVVIGPPLILFVFHTHAHTHTHTHKPKAPEIIQSKKHDEKADIYSFGVILWELLTRSIPFQSMQPIQIACAVAFQGQLHPPTHTLPHSQLIMCCSHCWD